MIIDAIITLNSPHTFDNGLNVKRINNAGFNSLTIPEDPLLYYWERNDPNSIIWTRKENIANIQLMYRKE